jgi:hypothetical protein
MITTTFGRVAAAPGLGAADEDASRFGDDVAGGRRGTCRGHDEQCSDADQPATYECVARS